MLPHAVFLRSVRKSKTDACHLHRGSLRVLILSVLCCTINTVCSTRRRQKSSTTITVCCCGNQYNNDSSTTEYYFSVVGLLFIERADVKKAHFNHNLSVFRGGKEAEIMELLKSDKHHVALPSHSYETRVCKPALTIFFRRLRVTMMPFEV